MADDDTLLGYLVPRYANVTENAATDALAYIMNRSAACMQSLNELVQPPGGAAMQPVTRVETQVVSEDRRIPDFVGFDENGDKRVVGESKFWAGIGECQASDYLNYLPKSGPSVLLFVVPEVRMDRLWAAVRADAERCGGWQLADDSADGATRRSAVVLGKADNPGDERRLMMVSWGRRAHTHEDQRRQGARNRRRHRPAARPHTPGGRRGVLAIEPGGARPGVPPPHAGNEPAD